MTSGWFLSTEFLECPSGWGCRSVCLANPLNLYGTISETRNVMVSRDGWLFQTYNRDAIWRITSSDQCVHEREELFCRHVVGWDFGLWGQSKRFFFIWRLYCPRSLFNQYSRSVLEEPVSSVEAIISKRGSPEPRTTTHFLYRLSNKSDFILDVLDFALDVSSFPIWFDYADCLSPRIIDIVLFRN